MKALNLLFTVALATSLSACGKEHKIVLDVDLQTLTDGSKDYAQLKALVDIGNLNVSGAIDIPHPKDPSIVVGTVSLFPTDQPQQSELTLKFDLDESFYGMGADGTTLPNGAPIPVEGLGNAHPVAFKAGHHSRAYVALGENVAMLGAALVIKEFDGLTEKIPYVNLFPSFNLGKLRGTAGLFTGAEPLQSGVAIFIDAGSVFNRADSVKGRLMSFGSSSSQTEINAVSKGLYKLGRKSAPMSIR